MTEPVDKEIMSNPIKILLVDDEAIIRDNLGALLERNGFLVTTAANGSDALIKLETSRPQVVVLDVMMPQMSGREVLRQIREANDWTPVILLTQIGDADERAMALEEGADDYLNKPFNTHELTARIRTVLRRAQSNQPPLTSATSLTSGQLHLDRTSHRVFLAGKEVTLTPKAITLLEYLMTHPDELVSRDRLLDAVWGWDDAVGTRAVDTRIAELRRLLGDNANQPVFIETISGQGYRFLAEVHRDR